MCNRYRSPSAEEICAHWPVDRAVAWQGGGVYPRAAGPFLRRRREGSAVCPEPGDLELVTGQWGLIPWFARTPKLPYSTNNARSEELATKASYKVPWARGQRCLIPAWSFDEPCWETGRNVWWRFTRADGKPWVLAGVWNTWVDKSTGEVHESYTMLTLNADEHPIMRRMHKPDPKLPADQQDKRSVIAIADEEIDTWLDGTIDAARALLKAPAVDAIEAVAL